MKANNEESYKIIHNSSYEWLSGLIEILGDITLEKPHLTELFLKMYKKSINKAFTETFQNSSKNK